MSQGMDTEQLVIFIKVKEIMRLTLCPTVLKWYLFSCFIIGGMRIDAREDPHLMELLKVGLLCNNAQISDSGEAFLLDDIAHFLS